MGNKLLGWIDDRFAVFLFLLLRLRQILQVPFHRWTIFHFVLPVPPLRLVAVPPEPNQVYSRDRPQRSDRLKRVSRILEEKN